jgi:hypothetical protein
MPLPEEKVAGDMPVACSLHNVHYTTNFYRPNNKSKEFGEAPVLLVAILQMLYNPTKLQSKFILPNQNIRKYH